MEINNKELKKRILEISFKHGLSHLGSCLTAVDIIEDIYQTKKLDEKFILSSGHAGLALYVVIEKHLGIDAEKIWLHHGTHPDRCKECHLDCSTGSLGQGLPIAVGMALADRAKNVYCLISDGECAEGSIHEAFRIAKGLDLQNLKIFINVNGWGAYQSTDKYPIPYYDFINSTRVYTDSEQLPFLKGLDAHYHAMTEEEFQQGMEILE